MWPSATESHLIVRCAAEVEGEWLVEDLFVPVGRWMPESDTVAGADLLPAQLDVPGRRATEVGHRRAPPQDLVDRSLHQPRIRPEPGEFRGVLCQREHSVRNRIA